MRRERTRQRWTLGHGSWTESYGAGRVEFVASIAARTAYRKGDRMAGPAEIVERYFDAWTSKDFETARSLLHDDLAFRGPLETVADADALLRSLQRLAQIVTGVERRGVIASGEEVAVIYDLHTVPIESAPVAEWYTLRDGKIESIQAFFDARPFAALFEQREA
jgi:ketosteroid isomerase-like protein